MPKLLDGFKRKRNLGFFFSRYKPELDRSELRKRFPKTYAKFGKAFLSSFPTRFYKGKEGTFVVDLKKSEFEAPMQVSLVTNRTVPIGQSKKFTEFRAVEVFNIKLDFYKDTVKITAIQGGTKITKFKNEFESISSMPIPQFLIQLIEEHARAQGYTKVQITRPEKNPHTKTTVGFQLDQMVSRTSRGRQLVKKFMKSLETGPRKGPPLTKAEKAEFKHLSEQARAQVLKRRRKMYTATAEALGYTPRKNWFEKSLV
jgi:hypothetical protein